MVKQVVNNYCLCIDYLSFEKLSAHHGIRKHQHIKKFSTKHLKELNKGTEIQ